MAYEAAADRFLAFFRPEVLAQYRERADRYELRSDNFEGRLTLSKGYYSQLNDYEKDAEYLDVLFGYRTLQTGELCIVAFKHDIARTSKRHIELWAPYLIEKGECVDFLNDPRFSLWYRRYAEGDWDVDNGPGFHLVEEIRSINALAIEAVGIPLYDVGHDPLIVFPAADNTWRYEDAHVSLYGVLIDGLSLPCIRAFAARLGRKMDPAATRTLNAIQNTLFPSQLGADARFKAPMENISVQRGNGSHGVRPAAKRMNAFEQFSKDLEESLEAIRLLKVALEQELGMNAHKSRIRQDALALLPKISGPVQDGASALQSMSMQGKTIEKVEVGCRSRIDNVHQSEVMILYFTDGSQMSIDTGSNAGNLRCEKHQSDDFHVDLRVHWVPAP